MRKKKKKEPPNVTKLQSHVMLVLHNVRMVPSNVRKNKETTECDKSTVICNIGTAQCKDGTIIYKKKIRKLPNVIKVQSYMMLVLHNAKMMPSNVMFW